MDIKKKLKNNLMLAPLAGYTDVGFRQLCAEYGCRLVVTEMISAMALKQNNRISFEMLQDKFIGTDDTLRFVQLFGHDAEVFKSVVQSKDIQKFDGIDLNMGCPMPKIVRNKEGCYLMKDMDNAAKIIETCVNYSDKPVSVKFRKGYKVEKAVEFAQMCQARGACFVTVHGRTQEQMYRGQADHDIIADVVAAVDIPVFANGDIKTKEDVAAVLGKTGAFGAAIGRGALGKPYLFGELSGQMPTIDLAVLICRHVDILTDVFREEIVLNEMKKHYVWYLKGIPGSKAFLDRLFRVKTLKQQKEMLTGFLSPGGAKELFD